MARRTNQKIWKNHIILCEGRDAEEVLISYLNSDALSDEPAFSNDFQVMDFGGITDLTPFIATLKNMEGYDRIESLLIIRDAERDPEQAIRDIKSALTRNALVVPTEPHRWEGSSPRIGYLLFPFCETDVCPGTLEDLCLSILSESNNQEILTDIQSFMDALQHTRGRVFPHEFKTKLHTYFSITDAYVSLKTGESAKAGAFDWSNPKLASLKNFLLELLS